ncbi:MAG: hypothetical protein GWP05_04800 [Anaerolineaceae bacterium]|nr:hypothetical protein [Anaerolineaceae bacterium]
MSVVTASDILAAHLNFDPFGGYSLALPLGAMFALALLLGYGRMTRQVGGRTRRILLALRGGAALAVIFVLMRPTLVSVSTRYERPLVVIMKDVSRSMSIRDEGPRDKSPDRNSPMATRSEAVHSELKRNEKLLRELAAKYDLATYQFSDKLTSVAKGLARPVAARGPQLLAQQVSETIGAVEPADGPSTRLGDCLSAAYEENVRRKILGVVLMTDGQSNLSQARATDVARRFGKLSIPIHSVAYGSAEPTGAVRDSIARDIEARSTVFVGNRTEVSGEFLFHGLKGRQIGVRLLVDGKVVAREQVKVPSNRFTRRVRLPYRASAPGSHKLELEAGPVEGEQCTTNNRISTFVDVVKGGLKVLLVRGFLRPEGAYISRSVRQAGEFDVDSVVLITRRQAARLVPDTVQGWADYEVVLFDDVPRSYLSARQASSLKAAVADGVGFLMIGGEHAFASGGYAGTPLADLLPVRITSGQGQIAGPLKFQPKPAGLQMRILQLEKNGSAQAWKSLPPLAGANVVGPPKSSAEVLAVGGNNNVPLLVVGQYRKGRVAALTVDTTWQWYLQGSDDPPGKYHRRFWRQLLLYLTGQDTERRGNVWVMTSQQRYSLPNLLSKRRAVVATAGVSDGQGIPVTDATCTLTLSGPGGPGGQSKRDVAVRRRGDNYEAVIAADRVGDYKLELAAFRGGKKVGQAATRFVVWEPDLEMEMPQADLEGLAELSRISGGKAYRSGELRSVLRSLLARDVTNPVKFEQRRGLWDNFAMLAVFASLLAAEWVLRKRCGLV